MALTQPFINNLPAFDATKGGNEFNVNILGGDTINGIEYTIYATATGSSVYKGDKVVTDNGGGTIRSFALPLPTSGLTNNDSYNITARSYYIDTAGNKQYSINSSPAFFRCFATPSVAVYYTNEMGQQAALTSGLNLGSEVVTLTAKYSLGTGTRVGDNRFNYGSIQIYGIANGNEVLVADSDTLYDDPMSAVFDGIAQTGTTTPYSSYTIVTTAHSVDGMVATQTISGVVCIYLTPSLSTGYVTAYNNAQSGDISINIDIPNTEFTGESQEIGQVLLKIKESAEREWITLYSFDITDTEKANGLKASMRYNYARNNTLYDIGLTAIGKNGNASKTATTNVFSCFYKSYIVDARTKYDITEEWTVAAYNKVQAATAYETFGRQYPIVGKNAILRYRQGSYTAVLLASTSMSTRSSFIDRKAQYELIEEFSNWLVNGAAKIIKSFNGDNILVFVTETVSNTYYKEIGNAIGSSSFSWVEIGKVNQEYLLKTGMLGNFIVAIPSV